MDALTRTLKATIEAADHAITTEDFDELMKFYADDATLVVKPGLTVSGKDSIRRAFVAIAEHFNHSIVVTQGEMQVIPGADVALVVMETLLQATDKAGDKIENSYGTTLLDNIVEP